MSTLMRKINVISRCSAMYRTERLRDTDIGTCHLVYILTVCKTPGISQEEITRQVYINKSNVTRQLAYLEEHGYVERRQSDTDRRVTLVYPTQKADDILPLVSTVIADWNDFLTDGFSEDELKNFTSMLERLESRAREYADRREPEQ